MTSNRAMDLFLHFSRALSICVLVALPEAVIAKSYNCIEVKRHSFAFDTSMTPAYPGRKINFSIEGNRIIADGLFFHSEYDVDMRKNSDQSIWFRAHAFDLDREDIFLFVKNTLYHTAIIYYGREPSIQLNILECKPIIE